MNNSFFSLSCNSSWSWALLNLFNLPKMCWRQVTADSYLFFALWNNPSPAKINARPHTQWFEMIDTIDKKLYLLKNLHSGIKGATPRLICLVQRKRKPAQSAKINTGCKRDVSSLRWAVGRCKMQSGYIVRKTWGTKGYMSFQQSFPQEKDA